MVNKPGFFKSIPHRILRHRTITAILLIASTILVGAGVFRLNINMDLESFFLENDPVKKTYHRFREYFGSDQFIYIVYRAKDGNVFSEKSLDALSQVHRYLEDAVEKSANLPASPFRRITDIKSLMDISYLESEGDTLRARKFVSGADRGNEKDRETLRKEALEHPSYVPSIINRTGDFSVIIIETDLGATGIGQPINGAGNEPVDEEKALLDAFDSTDPGHSGPVDFVLTSLWEYQSITSALQNALRSAPLAKNLEFYPVGNPVVMKFFADVFTVEVSALTGLSIVLILIVLTVLFRSLKAVAGAMIIVLAALFWTLGACGWIGATMTLMITIIIFLTLSVGISDAVHILSGYQYLRASGLDRRKAMEEVFRTSGLACFLTSLTTVIGLCALTIIPVIPLKVFGIFSAMGVFLAFVFTMLVLPFILWNDIRPARKSVASRLKPHPIQRIIIKAEPLVYKQPLAVCLVFLAISAIFAYGVFQIRVDTNMQQIISKRNVIHQDMVTVEENMGGTMNMEILIESGKEDGLRDPRLLAAISQLQVYLETHHPDFIVSTYSLADSVKESFQALNESRKDFYRIPETRDMLAQTLLLFESAAYDDRIRLVTDDYANARISVRIRNRGSYAYTAFFEEVNTRINAITAALKTDYPELKVTITGGFALTMNLSEFVSWSQIRSFSLALGVISFLFIFVFRSLKGGLVSIIPNLFPILVSFGLMGFIGFRLDLDTLLVAPIAIGIAVDDTIHFLSHYRLEVIEHGNIEKAIRNTFREVGQAMIFTSLILGAGFLIFTFSQHNGLSHFGLLAAVAIFSAVIADLFFLPRLCMLTGLDFKKTED